MICSNQLDGLAQNWQILPMIKKKEESLSIHNSFDLTFNVTFACDVNLTSKSTVKLNLSVDTEYNQCFFLVLLDEVFD